MGSTWSNFKADLKLQHYEPNHGNVTAIMNEHRPDCVPKDQWISLVTYWISDEGKSHNIFLLSLMNLCYNVLYWTVNGVEPSRAHIYVDTHKDRKTRPAPMDEKSKKAMDMINEKLSQLPGGKEVTNGIVAWEGDIYSQVMTKVIGEERRGRVCGLGLGPSSLVSLSSSQCGEHLDDDHDQCSERMEFLEAENKQLRDKLTRLEGQQTEVLAQIARLRALVDDSMTDDATPSNSIRTQNVA
ncbi:hypothetical protein Cgig2_018036 [Carnegiea gigantea]|uniref:Transposase n=1 Tax=Carnegiea gigantea TaxID=171969 RepID=A0A9Q1JZ65_9CARY|nr:hypothetical protein Cgig2_018036 [Carnegiea gigantea]